MKISKTIFLCILAVTCSCSQFEDLLDDAFSKLFDDGSLKWYWLESGVYESCESSILHKELFGSGNPLRLLQSMSIYDDKAFCFNEGTECYVFDMKTKTFYPTEPLPQFCHHNNAQFLDIYYDEEDKYPLLLLSRGNYPPDDNEFYIIRIVEENNSIYFNKVKTIKNTLSEAQNNGSWVADIGSNRLYLYTMTKSDWRVTKDNYFCIFTFDLPDLLDETEVTLTYSDVKSYWQYKYLIHQGGTFYNGYLLFNVQRLYSVGDNLLKSSFNVIVINCETGQIDAVLPLDESLETEGISVYNDKLFISFKNGSLKQNEDDVVFRLNEYTLPPSMK